MLQLLDDLWSSIGGEENMEKTVSENRMKGRGGRKGRRSARRKEISRLRIESNRDEVVVGEIGRAGQFQDTWHACFGELRRILISRHILDCGLFPGKT
eukprot:78446-Hanusia_phi.AAC.1